MFNLTSQRLRLFPGRQATVKLARDQWVACSVPEAAGPIRLVSTRGVWSSYQSKFNQRSIAFIAWHSWFKKLTTGAGIPVAVNQNGITCGYCGPQQLNDNWFLGKLSHFAWEVITKKRIHANESDTFCDLMVTAETTFSRAFKIISKIGK